MGARRSPPQAARGSRQFSECLCQPGAERPVWTAMGCLVRTGVLFQDSYSSVATGPPVTRTAHYFVNNRHFPIPGPGTARPPGPSTARRNYSCYNYSCYINEDRRLRGSSSLPQATHLTGSRRRRPGPAASSQRSSKHSCLFAHFPLCFPTPCPAGKLRQPKPW